MNPRRRTLKARIAATFVAWVVLFDLMLVLAIPMIRERFTLGVVDERLGSQALAIAGQIVTQQIKPEEVVDLGEREPLLGTEDSRRLLYQVTGESGSPVYRSGLLRDVDHLPTRSLATEFIRSGVTSPVFQTIRSRTGGPDAEPVRYRIATLGVRAPNGAFYHLLVASSLRTTDTLGSILIWTLLGSLVPGVLIAALSGWIVASRVVARLDRISGAIRGVSPSRIHQRIALPTGHDEIGAMAADVNAMLDRISTTHRGMERYMSEVSHELRTPVATLLAEAQVIKRSARPEAIVEFADTVEDEMRRLTRLVDSFLTLARFEHGTAFLARGLVNLNDAAIEAVQHTTRFAQRTGVRLSLNLYEPSEAESDPVVRGDAELIRIALDNILRNAMQFSPDRSAVDLHISRDAERTTVTIRDRGPGIPAEYIDRIFDRFVQAPGPRAGGKGLGLGLAIAKAVVDAHKATIKAGNHPDGGSVFTITFTNAPAGRTHSAASRTPPEGPA
jgi:two-component system, OmpR family, sensor kinase